MHRNTPGRAALLSALALAQVGRLVDLAAEVDAWPGYEVLRGPETGLVPLPARADGSGELFVLADLLTTHISICDQNGYTGIGWVLGDNAEHALWIARWDAFLQEPRSAERYALRLLATLEEDREQRNRQRESELQTTQVEFFTLGNPG
ncbi:MAG: phosphonate C-P lyase system protein PhnG [Candidatus Igneacidithiobacillus chanchocoensis]